MNKKMIVGLVVILLVIGGLFAFGKLNTKKTVEKAATQETPADVIPTVDKSTTVGIVPKPGNKEIRLDIFGIPSGTTSVDYELSYQTKAQGTQGVIGTVTTFKDGSMKKDITLGTCSSGKCVYHELVGPMNVTIKFTGDYGEKMYENKFNL